MFFTLFAGFVAAAQAQHIPRNDNSQVQGDGLLRFPLRVSSGAPIVKGVTRRQEEVALEAQLNGNFYSIDLTIGTPGQTVTVNFDTGSPELWVNPDCSQADNPEFCESFGHFNESSSFQDLGTQGTIIYGTGMVRFNRSTDYIAVGAARISQQIFGVADTSFVTNVGVMGASPWLSGWEGDYPLVLDNLATQGFINSRAFSLDIRSIGSDKGSVIFGGIDTRKFSGQLEKRPIIPGDDSPDGYTRYWVYLDGLTLVQNGKKIPIFSKPTRQAVMLDSGYTLSTLPGPIVQAIVESFPTAKTIPESPLYSVDCSVMDMAGTVDFLFGETLIKVPYRDFIWKRPDGACRLGVFQDDNFPVLGDTFLRAAYVVYDWDNRNIWLANNEDCGSKLVTIGKGPNAVPALTGECSRSDGNTTVVPTTSLPANSTAVPSSTQYHNTSMALTTSGSYPAVTYPTGHAGVTSTVTYSEVHTITSCPPTATNCPVGSVTTELVTSYHVINCPGNGACGGQVTRPVTAKVPQSTAIYTIHMPTMCRCRTGCPKEAYKTENQVITVKPVKENPYPTPIHGPVSHPSNHTATGIYSASTTTGSFNPHGCTTCHVQNEPAGVPATDVAPSGAVTTGIVPTPVIAGAASKIPGVFFAAVGLVAVAVL
ncbi:Peptidase A1 domain-containing protein [Fusarium sp. LHS14.1]|nr:Peptidase A1 domain-containing protein [Fusarium sp. LHS14.1]